MGEGNLDATDRLPLSVRDFPARPAVCHCPSSWIDDDAAGSAYDTRGADKVSVSCLLFFLVFFPLFSPPLQNQSSSNPKMTHILFHTHSSLTSEHQYRLTCAARTSVFGSSINPKMWIANSTGREDKKSRLSNGAMVVEMKRSSEGVQLLRTFVRNCLRRSGFSGEGKMCGLRDRGGM